MKKYKDRILASLLIVFGVLVVSWFIHDDFAKGSVTQKSAGSQVGTFRIFTFFASSTTQINYATSTTATSTSSLIDSYFDSFGAKDNGYFVVAGAKRVTVYFSRQDNTPITGTSTFSIEASPDGTTWFPYRKLISNVSNTNGQELTRVHFVNWAAWNYPSDTGGVTLNSATTTYSIDQADSIYAIRCLAGSLTDGNQYCTATADW